MADLSTRLTLVSTEGELALLQVVHSHVEKLYRTLLPIFSVHPQVHVPIIRRVVVSDE
jgi:hypothetical protein